MGNAYNDVDLISNIIKSLGIRMEIDQWTHDATVWKGDTMIQDADSLYLDVIRKAQDIRYTSKYLNKTFIGDIIKANAIYIDRVKEFFDNNEWDGGNRFPLVQKALRISRRDLWKLRIWMRQGAALVYNDGSKSDVQRNFMLIMFSSKQGNGKSTLAKKLSLNTASFGDCSIDLKSKESMRRAYESWIYEYPELSSMFRRADVNMLKTFITASAQNFRLPYDKFFTKYPTRTSIIGTTNDDAIFIDDTGSRRFLVINANWGRQDWAAINDVDWASVWLQARHEYLLGMPIVMTSKEQMDNEIDNEAYSYTNATTYSLLNHIEELVKSGVGDKIRLTDIIEYLLRNRMDPSTKMIFSCMRKLGYKAVKTGLTQSFVKLPEKYIVELTDEEAD